MTTGGLSEPGARTPLLALVLDAEAARRPGLVRAAVRGGVDWVQLRERGLEARDLLELVDAVTADARAGSPRARVIVNRRVDVAWAAGADGVHLGFDAVDAADARGLLGVDALVGTSLHAVDEVPTPGGAESPESYVHLAPIHAPLSKASSRAPLGERALAAAADRAAAIAVIAQGGIDASNARAAIAAGAAGVAVTGAIVSAEDPERAARALREALDG